jgi:adhesin transport system outer membrane protein
VYRCKVLIYMKKMMCGMLVGAIVAIPVEVVATESGDAPILAPAVPTEPVDRDSVRVKVAKDGMVPGTGAASYIPGGLDIGAGLAAWFGSNPEPAGRPVIVVGNSSPGKQMAATSGEVVTPASQARVVEKAVKQPPVAAAQAVAPDTAAPLVMSAAPESQAVKADAVKLVAPNAGALTMRVAVELATQVHPLRRRAQRELEATGYQKEAANWLRYPTLAVSAGGTVLSSNSNDPTSSIALSQPLWAGGRIDATIDAANTQVTAAEANESEVRQRLSEQVAVVYIEWLRATERLQTAKEGGALLHDLVEHVKRKQAVGNASPSDVAIALARYSTAMNLVTELRGALDQAKAALQNLTLMSDLGASAAVEVPPFDDADLGAIETAYLANSPLIAQRYAEVATARNQVRVKHGEMYPTVALRLEQLFGVQSGTGGAYSDTRASIQLSYTPGAGLASYSNYQQAGAMVEAASAQFDSEENDVRKRARLQYSEYAVAKQQFNVLEPQAKAIDLIAQSFRRQFEAGRKSWMDVLNIYREATDVKINLSRVKGQRDQAAIRLMVNTGALSAWLKTQP